VLKVTAPELDVAIEHKGEKVALSLVLAPARNGDEVQLPVAAVAVAVLPVAELAGPAPYNVEPIPGLYSQERDWPHPFLQK